MNIVRHRDFIKPDTLNQMHGELINSPGWVFRERFWRYYLIDGLEPYNESQPMTWYHNQPGALARLRQPWRDLFDQVYDLAGNSFQLMRYALTGQTQNQIPVLHTDTTVGMPGKWRSYLLYLNVVYPESYGGTTDFVVDNQIVHQEFPEPGKLVEFDSQILHIGNPPEQPNVLRISLVLHGMI